MALTLPRWAVMVTLGCAAIAVALLPVQPRTLNRSFTPGQSTPLQRVTGQLERARDSLTLVALGDSALAIARKSPLPAGGEPTILPLGAATADERRAFAQNVSQWWPDTGLDTTIAVGLVLGGDSQDQSWQVRHMLPASGDGRTCVTLVPTQTWKLSSRMPGLRALELHFSTELGPCLFFALYGRPGPQIERWLAGRGVDFVGYFNPSGRSIGESVDPPEGPSIHNSLFEIEWAMYGTMPLAIKCLAGHIAECAAGVSPGAAAAGAVSPGFHAPLPPWRAPFGNLTSSFIADLHRELGPVQFREFWQSSGTLEDAFRQVTGRTLGEWTYRWAIGRRNRIRPGPLPESRSVLRVAGLTVLLLGAAVAWSVHRKVV